jgi:hypothetical protein
LRFIVLEGESMNYSEEKKHYISYCGSYCRTCDWFTGRIRKIFNSSLKMQDLYQFRKLLDGNVNPDNFKKGLQSIANSGICSGCKAEIVKNPYEDRCKIRQCAFSRGFELCSDCPEFPCETLKSKPGVKEFHCIENLSEIRDKGVKYWIDKQWDEYTARENTEE